MCSVSHEVRVHAVKLLLRMALDHRLQKDVSLQNELEDTIAVLVDGVDGEPFTELVSNHA